jgi:hypothetical protein
VLKFKSISGFYSSGAELKFREAQHEMTNFFTFAMNWPACAASLILARIAQLEEH